MRKRYTNEFKQEIVSLYESGIMAKQICTEYQLPKSVLYEWIKIYKKRTDKNYDIFTYKEILNAQKKLKDIQRELDIIKKTKCFPESPRKRKLEAIDKLFGQYPVKVMCRILEVDHATFYNYHFRRVKQTQYYLWDEFLKPKIVEIFEKSQQRFGARKIRAKLKEENIIVSEEKIRKLMKNMGLVPQLVKRKNLYPKSNPELHLTDKVQREFIQEHPNKVWVGDITSAWVDVNIYYVCAIMDLFSRKVIAARVSYKKNSKLTMNTFKDAFELRKEPQELIFHSGRGGEYVAYEYRALLKSIGVDQSFSNAGTPYDNVMLRRISLRKCIILNKKITDSPLKTGRYFS